MELVVIVYDLVLVENLAKHKSIDGITIAEVDSASGHLSHADLLDEGEVFYGGMFDGRYSRWDISFVPRRGKNRKTMDTKKYITTVKNHFLRRHRARGSTHLMYSTILFEKKIQNIFNRKYSCGVFKPNAAFGLVTPLHMVRSGLN